MFDCCVLYSSLTRLDVMFSSVGRGWSGLVGGPEQVYNREPEGDGSTLSQYADEEVSPFNKLILCHSQTLILAS